MAGGGTIEVVHAFGPQTLVFGTGNGTLRLDAAGGTNDVFGFVPGDTIEFGGHGAAVTFTAGTLNVTNGPFALGSFVMHGAPANAQFQVATDINLNSFITETIPCFLAGTRIRTPIGDIAVETLLPGNPVLALRAGTAQPVRWIGHRRVETARHPDPRAVWPVRVRAHAIAENVPARDLFLSPEHAVFLNGVLVPVRHLINGTSIAQLPRAVVVYYHVELPHHDLVLAEGMACETYLDTGNRADFDNAGAVLAAHPRFATANDIWRARACAPQCRGGTQLDAIRAQLDRRAGVPELRRTFA